jgi:hypothetical protein
MKTLEETHKEVKEMRSALKLIIPLVGLVMLWAFYILITDVPYLLINLLKKTQ